MQVYVKGGSAQTIVGASAQVAVQTCCLSQSQCTDTSPTSPSANPVMPHAWRGIHYNTSFEVTGRSGPGHVGINSSISSNRRHLASRPQRQCWSHMPLTEPFLQATEAVLISQACHRTFPPGHRGSADLTGLSQNLSSRPQRQCWLHRPLTEDILPLGHRSSADLTGLSHGSADPAGLSHGHQSMQSCKAMM